MTIKTFQDIENIDQELAGLFLHHDEAINWIGTVNSDIKEWIAKHNKQHWEIVRYVSEKSGILGKLQTNKRDYKLTRKDFAEILIKFCPAALKEGETASALKSSMEHYLWLNEYGRGPSGSSLARKREVEGLFEHHPIEQPETNDEPPSLEDLMAGYLRRVISDRERYPRSVLRVREQYGDTRPALSVETYYSKELWSQKHYSHVDAYEFVEERLTKNKLYELAGEYSDIAKLRLFIVSTHSLSPDVRKLVLDKEIGYVLLDPRQKPASPEYVLPRSLEDYVKQRHDMEILLGQRPMNSPMLIMDGDNVTSSLSDILLSHSVAVKPREKLEIPFLQEDMIEAKADELSADYVDSCLRKKHLWDSSVALSLDPFAIADQLGLSHSVEPLGDGYQLGRFDIVECHVTLNSSGKDNNSRFRFTMAHELGHYLLHKPWFSRCGIVSVGETDNTLSSEIIFDRRRIEIEANHFASYLLMPTKLVRHLYNYFYEKYVHQVYGDRLQKLYYNPSQPETRPQYNNVVGRMATLLEVSATALNIKLKSMKLLEMP